MQYADTKHKDEHLLDALATIETVLEQDTINTLNLILQMVKGGNYGAVATATANLQANEAAKLITAIAYLKAVQVIEPNHVLCTIVEKVARTHKEEFFLPRYPEEMLELVSVVETRPEMVFSVKLVLGVMLGSLAKSIKEVGL